MDRSKLAVAQVFATQGEADLAKGMLESAGIRAIIQADTAGGMDLAIAWSDLGFRVLVREEDAAEARELLEPPHEAELVFLQIFPTQAEADIASDTLLSAGIVATIQNAVTDIPLPLSSNDFGFRLLVRKEDADKARYVLKQLSEAPAQEKG